MILRRSRKLNIYDLRPRCKKCHNEKERKHRREYKKSYLQKWRKKNAELSKTYGNNPETKKKVAENALKRFNKKHEAILIQGRMRRRGINVGIDEAEELLKTFGRCYPSPQGLSKEGLRECERIRSRLRVSPKTSFGARMPTNFEIRLMVYEDSLEDTRFLISPEKQPIPYQKAAERLRKYHQKNTQIKSK